jgi:hypothetical protein
VRQTLVIPEGANVSFFASDSGRGLLHQQLIVAGPTPPAPVPVDETSPLRFIITWSLPGASNEQG